MWIIQNNMNYELGVEEIKSYLSANKIPFTLIDIYKDDDQFYLSGTKDKVSFDNRNDVFGIGSYRFVRMMQEMKITPGSFSNEYFNYSSWIDHWGDLMLNSDSIVRKISDIEIPDNWEQVFSRPLKDNKLFTGGLFRKEDLLFDIQSKVINDKNKNEEIIISQKKNIESEYRLFVVNGKVVTGSMYKMRKQVIISEFVDKSVLSFADECLSIWQPSKAFALDIAITDKGCKIIEINNISSAGLYRANVDNIVTAIEDLK